MEVVLSLIGSPLSSIWKRYNDMVFSWVFNVLHKDIRSFQNVSNNSQGDLDIVNYFNKAKRLWAEFAAVGALPKGKCTCIVKINYTLRKYDDEQRVLQFLMGLGENCTPMRRNLLMIDLLPSLGQVYSLALQEEKQRYFNNGSSFLTESASFNAMFKHLRHHINTTNITKEE